MTISINPVVTVTAAIPQLTATAMQKLNVLLSTTVDISSVNVMTDWGNKIMANIREPSLFDGLQLLTYFEVRGALALLHVLSFAVTIMGYIGVAFLSVIAPRFICWFITSRRWQRGL